MSTLDNIFDEIKKANSIVIMAHKNPDGDAIGSALGLYGALKNFGKTNLDLIIPEYPKIFNFLPNADEIKKDSDVVNYDLAITVDCASFEMVDDPSNKFENATTTVVIDHHGTNTMFGDLNFVNPDAPACAEILIVALSSFGMKIDKKIGTCLLTGIITDTGGFKYQGVTAETFEFVAGLLRKGVNVSDTYRRVFQVKTKSAFELGRIANNRLEFLEDGKIAYTYITLDDCKNVNAGPGDQEGIVEVGRDVEGVEVSVFVRELKTGELKVSLRSNENVDIDEVAVVFGGGGHPKAAGFSIKGDFDSVKNKIISEIKRYL